MPALQRRSDAKAGVEPSTRKKLAGVGCLPRAENALFRFICSRTVCPRHHSTTTSLRPFLGVGVAQAVFASLRSHLDLVAFTEEVPQVRRYLTKRFAAPGGVLTPEAEAALDRGAVSREQNTKRGLWLKANAPRRSQMLLLGTNVRPMCLWKRPSYVAGADVKRLRISGRTCACSQGARHEERLLQPCPGAKSIAPHSKPPLAPSPVRAASVTFPWRFFIDPPLSQLHNANNVKTIRLGDFDPAELEQLNTTVQLDWRLYKSVLGDTHHRRVDLERA